MENSDERVWKLFDSFRKEEKKKEFEEKKKKIEEKEKKYEAKERRERKISIIAFIVVVLFIISYIWYIENTRTITSNTIFSIDIIDQSHLNNTFYNKYKFIDGCENDKLYCIVNIKGFDKSLRSYEEYRFNLMDFAEVKCIPECEEARQSENQINWSVYCSDSGSKSHQYLLFNRTMYEEDVRRRNENFCNAGFCS